MGAISDQAVIDLYRSGNRAEAFRKLVAQHGKSIYNIALFTLGDEILAEDATQDTMIRVYKHLGKFKGDAKLSSWLYRIVKNVCYDSLRRKQSSHSTMPEDEPADENGISPEGQFFVSDRHAALRQAVSRLPKQQRLAITLHYFKQMSYEEIAEVMEQPLGTIKSHMYRAKKLLAEVLTELNEESR